MGKFELSIAEDYVASWGIVEAVREFFQNAIDQETVEKDNKMFFEYSEDEKVLRIGNLNSVLDVSTLLLGTTTKADSDNTIGQFGEGYKIATLVALRTDHPVIFYNYGKKEVWKPRLVNSKRYGAKVLTFFTESFIWKKPPTNNLTIEIGNVTADEYTSIVRSNLRLVEKIDTIDCSLGRVLLDEKYHGSIFLSGLFVCNLEELKYGYDLPASSFKLDRDRKMLSTIDVAFYTSRVWTCISDTGIIGSHEEYTEEQAKEYRKILLDLIEDEDFYDAKYVDCAMSSYYSGEEDSGTLFCNEVYDSFKATHGYKAVPVSTNAQLQVARLAGKTAVLVTDSVHAMIKKSSKFNHEVECKGVTAKELLSDWFEKAKESLSDELVSDFEAIYDLL